MSSTTAPSLVFDHPADVHAAVHAASRDVSFLVVPASRWFAISGTSAPGTDPFRDAIGTLYPVAYTLHFALRRRGMDVPVGAMEGSYVVGDGSDVAGVLTGTTAPSPDWHWELRLPVPNGATPGDVDAAIADVKAKGRAAALDLLRIEDVPETTAAQVLHVGPYDAEAPTVARLLDSIAGAGLVPVGGHQEIYISDPNRTVPAHLKTVIRMTVRQAA